MEYDQLQEIYLKLGNHAAFSIFRSWQVVDETFRKSIHVVFIEDIFVLNVSEQNNLEF